MKHTAIAPSNIAFIKYWGRKEEALRLPANGSISMNLSNLLTTTTVAFSSELTEDEITISSPNDRDVIPNLVRDLKQENKDQPAGKAGMLNLIQHDILKDSSPAKPDQNDKVSKHLDRIRKLAGITEKAKVVSENSFPRGTGLSSSASGFAALTVAASYAAGLDLSEKELSILARQGSGSACRSIPDGFVEWIDGDTSETSYAYSLYRPDYWDIVDVVSILTTQQKDVSTTEGQKRATSSPFYTLRLQNMKNKIVKIKNYMKDKKFEAFGELVEEEALELHAIMLTSSPSLIYWYPATITVMKAVKRWRSEGLPVYFTLNTGQNIHILCQKKDAKQVEKQLKALTDVKEVMVNSAANGARIIAEHLF